MTTVTINVDQVRDMGNRLKSIDDATLGKKVLPIVNAVVKRARNEALKRMLSGINLTQAEVEREMRIEPATNPLRPVAVLIGNRKTTNTLRKYSQGAVLKANNWSNALVEKNIARNVFNKIPPGKARLPWKKRVGDKTRGIAAGMKAAGVTVEVIRGRRKDVAGWFLLPTKGGLLPARIKRSASKKWGRSRGDIEVLYGPGAWQLFKAKLPGLAPDVERDLRTHLGDVADDLANDILKNS